MPIIEPERLYGARKPEPPMNSPAGHIDHTLLHSDATAQSIELLCEEAVEQGFASVCVPPVHVQVARRCLYGSEVSVGTVISFPCGYDTTRVKVFQALRALEGGADELDMVIALGAAREGRFDLVEEDIREVVHAAAGKLVKVIVETCLFSDSVKKKLAEIVLASGASFIKTSTGFAAQGAKVEDIVLFKDMTKGRIGIKAAGGIRDWASCQAMLHAGADRIGTSNGLTIMDEWRRMTGL